MKQYTKMKDSGIEYVGDIPDSWDLEKLKHCFYEIKNGIWGEEPENLDESIICVRVADFDRQNYFVKLLDPTYRNIPNKDLISKKLNENCLLIERSGGGEKQPVGFVVRYNHQDIAVCSNFISLLKTKKEFNPNFLKYVFATMYFHGNNYRFIKQTTGIQNLDLQYLSEYFPIPKYEIQKLIGKNLDKFVESINQKIFSSLNLIELLNAKKHAYVDQLITQGIDRNVITTDSNISWIGKIPETWKISKFLHVLERKEKRNNDTIDRKMLSVSQYLGIIDKKYDFDSQIRTKEDSLRYFVVEKNDLVVNVMWLQFRGLAVSFIEGIVSPDYHVYSVNSSIILPQFLNYLVRSNVYLNEYPKHLRGIRPNSSRMPRYDFKRLPLILPPIIEQEKIVECLEESNNKISPVVSQLETQIKILNDFRGTIISLYTTGKINPNGVILNEISRI